MWNIVSKIFISFVLDNKFFFLFKWFPILFIGDVSFYEGSKLHIFSQNFDSAPSLDKIHMVQLLYWWHFLFVKRHPWGCWANVKETHMWGERIVVDAHINVVFHIEKKKKRKVSMYKTVLQIYVHYLNNVNICLFYIHVLFCISCSSYLWFWNSWLLTNVNFKAYTIITKSNGACILACEIICVEAILSTVLLASNISSWLNPWTRFLYIYGVIVK